jgi:hypothetical protein
MSRKPGRQDWPLAEHLQALFEAARALKLGIDGDQR